MLPTFKTLKKIHDLNFSIKCLRFGLTKYEGRFVHLFLTCHNNKYFNVVFWSSGWPSHSSFHTL